jgi:hypothetical protein
LLLTRNVVDDFGPFFTPTFNLCAAGGIVWETLGL